MNIMVAHNGKLLNGVPIETYALSMIRTLRDMGHSVIEVPKAPLKTPSAYKSVDFLLDIDCGRDDTGKLRWHGERVQPPCKSAVYLIDSHGYSSLHKRLATNYDHVFFAVWDKRDLFKNRASAHWCPNFTDIRWFNGANFTHVERRFDFGFFGSKGGLERAKPMGKIAIENRWSHSIRQVAASGKQRWPHTAEAMAECRFLFNHGQKHDGPNLRVMESMAMKRPLICDQDSRSGMDKLFAPFVHYAPIEYYKNKGLETRMQEFMTNPAEASRMAERAYIEVLKNHLVQNRIEQILEVVG
jgi:hypothetical protein